MKNYENRIVLFLDILGFKKIVDSTLVKDEEDIGKTRFLIDTINEMVEHANFSPEGTSKSVTQFSDSIVISFKENDVKEIPRLFTNLNWIIANLLSREILCRGAVSYGKLYHKDNLVFGPALVDAYETESQAALYPRVILDKSVRDVMLENYVQKSKNPTKIGLYSSDLDYYLETDTDDKYYIDYFSGSMMYFEDEKLFKVYKGLRRLIINGLKFKSPSIKVKFGWMKNKYNKLPEKLKLLNDTEELFYKRPDIEEFYKSFKPI